VSHQKCSPPNVRLRNRHVLYVNGTHLSDANPMDVCTRTIFLIPYKPLTCHADPAVLHGLYIWITGSNPDLGADMLFCVDLQKTEAFDRISAYVRSVSTTEIRAVV
jgi:hypothetical protein